MYRVARPDKAEMRYFVPVLLFSTVAPNVISFQYDSDRFPNMNATDYLFKEFFSISIR